MPADRRRAERAGRRAETLAALYLAAKLYKIVARRFKTPVGEIDLIAEKAGVLVFVEVKARGRGTDVETALLAVNRARIVKAARYYLARRPPRAGRAMRFDVIFLAPGRWPLHLKKAFEIEDTRTMT